MRIISGIHKGRRIIAPKKLPVRPTTDFAKEALFNILVNRFNFSELNVLDLFAGTGNISYEFASRGCTQITAVDAHKGCTQFIHKTASQLQLPIVTHTQDVFEYLKNFQSDFDIIFADPPYAFEETQYQQLIALILGNKDNTTSGVFILEHPKQIDFKTHPQRTEVRKYGSSHFSFFQ